MLNDSPEVASQVTTIEKYLEIAKEWDIYAGAPNTRAIANVAYDLSKSSNRIPELYYIILNVAFFVVVLAFVKVEEGVHFTPNNRPLYDIKKAVTDADEYHRKYWKKWRLTRYLKRNKYARVVDALVQSIRKTFEGYCDQWPVDITNPMAYMKEAPTSLTLADAVQWARTREMHMTTASKEQRTITSLSGRNHISVSHESLPSVTQPNAILRHQHHSQETYATDNRGNRTMTYRREERTDVNSGMMFTGTYVSASRGIRQHHTIIGTIISH
ncbi:hypothetical protein AX16_004903 [Volvariella volvacea WC 439]|nr:hypothetical protein AX16_004903 [Volvariella volvacea WC 439]